MLTVDEFITFFDGIYVDYDGYYGDQCFDLANAYSRWIGGQRFNGATADLIFNQPGDFYTQIPNTLDYVPQKGDLIMWNWPHVAVATGNNSDTNQFEVLEQNDPLNSNCHTKIYSNYNGVIGALRPIALPTTPVPQPTSQSIEDSEPSQTGVVSFTDQIKIPIGVDSHGYDWGEMELGAVRSTLGDQRSNIAERPMLVNTGNPDIPVDPPVDPQLSQTPPIAPSDPAIPVTASPTLFSQLLSFVKFIFS